jgi:hypothetical protein
LAQKEKNMSNPFDYIRQEHEKQETEKKAKEQRLAEEISARDKRISDEQQRINHLRQEAEKQFDGLVTDTLKLLLQAAFIDLSRQERNWTSGWEVRRHEDLSWSIGHVETQHGMEGGEWEGHVTEYPVWVWAVQVTLVLDSNNNPIKFYVYGKQKIVNAESKLPRRKRREYPGPQPEPIEAGLSKSELIEALKKLYPSDSTGK